MTGVFMLFIGPLIKFSFTTYGDQAIRIGTCDLESAKQLNPLSPPELSLAEPVNWLQSL